MGGAAPPMGAPGAGAGAALAQGAKASVAMNPQAQMMTQAAQRMQQQQQTLKTLIGAVTTADPSLKSDPAAAFEAVQKLIDLNKSMDESDRTMVNAELAYLKAQTAYVLGQGRLGVAEQNADTSARRADIQASGEQSLDAYRKGILDIDNKRLAEAWDAVKLRTSSQERIAAARNATTIQAAQIRSMTQEDVANKMIEFREQALQAGLDEKTWQALLTAQLKEQGMSDAFIAKVFASQASNAGASGQPLPAPPHRNQSALPPPPGRSPAGGPAPRSGGTPPPFPPSHDGLTATSPNGENWIVRGGKWVPA